MKSTSLKGQQKAESGFIRIGAINTTPKNHKHNPYGGKPICRKTVEAASLVR
jgi:hypothetical protein